MELNLIFVIAGGLFLFSVLLIGVGISMYRSQHKGPTGRITEEKLALRVEPPPQAAGLEPAGRSQAGEGPAAGVPAKAGFEILRVNRRPVDGGLTIHTMGQAADHVGEMTPGQVHQLKRIVREVALWVEGRGAPAADPGEDGAEASAADMSPAGADLVAPVAFADSLPPIPGPRVLPTFRRKNVPKPAEPPEPLRSIAVQINDILQAMVGASPLAGSELRLGDDPSGGLKITHDRRVYQAIDDVEDPAAKALIKQAVQVWNEKNKLG